jgi:hypothetical protein
MGFLHRITTLQCLVVVRRPLAPSNPKAPAVTRRIGDSGNEIRTAALSSSDGDADTPSPQPPVGVQSSASNQSRGAFFFCATRPGGFPPCRILGGTKAGNETFLNGNLLFVVRGSNSCPRLLMRPGQFLFAQQLRQLGDIRRNPALTVKRIIKGRCATRAGYSQGIHRQTRRSFFARMKGLALAMTVRIILIRAVAIMFGQSLAYGSPACMTESEARAKVPKAHLYRRGSCWSDSAAYGFRALPAVAVHSQRPALAVAPMPSPRPKIVSSDIDAGAQCRYSPCE